jgi:hypothetical protein
VNLEILTGLGRDCRLVINPLVRAKIGEEVKERTLQTEKEYSLKLKDLGSGNSTD